MKKKICIYCMRYLCAFLGRGWECGGSGKKWSVCILWTSLSSPGLFIDYLCIYWILFMSFWVFVLVFSGGLLWGLCLQRGGGRGCCSWDQDQKRRCQTNVFQRITKPKDCCNLRQREKVAGKLWRRKMLSSKLALRVTSPPAPFSCLKHRQKHNSLL